MNFLKRLFKRQEVQSPPVPLSSSLKQPPKQKDIASTPNKGQEFSALVGSAVGWMYGNRDLLNKGYSGEDPTFSEAKAAFLKGRGELSPDKKEELLRVFEEALNRV